jgi:hypothetical protein
MFKMLKLNQKCSAVIFISVFILMVCCKQDTSNVSEKNNSDTLAEVSTTGHPIVKAVDVFKAGDPPALAEIPDTHDMNDWFLPTTLLTAISLTPVPMLEDTTEGAKVIRYLSYGDTVRVTRAVVYQKMIDPISKKTMPGVWLEVSFGNTYGTVFSSYFASRDINTPPSSAADLILKGSSCYENFTYHPEYIFYGIYSSDDGQFLKKVKPYYFSAYDLEMIRDLHTVETDLQQDPLFILAIKQKLREEKLATVNLNEELAKGKSIQTGAYTLKGTIETDGTYSHYLLDFIDTNGIVVQHIDTHNLWWSGDLDQDGKIDLVYLEGEEKSGTIVLALSSLAEQGEAVKIISGYDVGYCC